MGLLAFAESRAAARDAEALSDLSLQGLMAIEVEVTSVARRGQSAKDAAAEILMTRAGTVIGQQYGAAGDDPPLNAGCGPPPRC